MTDDEKATERSMVDEAVGIDATAAVTEPAEKPKRRKPKVVDGWETRDIPPGATGPTVKKLRADLGFGDGLDVYDRRMKIRVVQVQRRLNLPETGVINAATRAGISGT